MNEETLGMIIGFLIVAPITAYVVYRFIKKGTSRRKSSDD